MTYSQFKAFHAVAMERSFQRAAERLSLTQPAMSIQVRNLEKASGQMLFRRKGGTVELTEFGRDLFEKTTQMFDAEQKCRAIISQSQAKPARVLHLGADGPHVALDLLKKFKLQCPDVQVRITLANADQTWENLNGLKVDAAIMANAKLGSHVVGRTLSRQGLTALIPLSLEMPILENVSLSELSSFPLIFRETGSNTQRVLEAALAEENLAVSPYLVMGSREGVREAVERGLGIGFLFSREAGQSENYRSVPIEGLDRSNEDMLICLKRARHTSPVQQLFDCV